MADLLFTVLVVCDGPDASPHALCSVVLEMLLDVQSVLRFCQLDALPQFFLGPSGSQFIPKPEISIPGLGQWTHRAVQPWFLIWKNHDGLCGQNRISTEPHIVQDS